MHRLRCHGSRRSLPRAWLYSSRRSLMRRPHTRRKHTNAHPSRHATARKRSGSANGETSNRATRKPRRPALITAVDRAARVLAVFSRSWDFLTLPEVSNLAGLSKPTTFRILATLMSEGLISQNEANATYGFGFQTLRLADVVLGTLPFAAATRQVLRDINSRLNETVVLSARQGPHCYFVHSVETTQSIGQTHALGVAAPLHTVAPGRAMLATWSDQAIRDYLRRCVNHPKVRSGHLLREIETIRARGFASSSGELHHGGHSLAMAIPYRHGQADAALHVSFPQGRYTIDLQQRCID